MMQFVKQVAGDLLDRKLGDGFNVIMNNLSAAGQVIPHAHIHVIPRKEGDGLRCL
ncbi:HIT domain-containing protein [Candidatus Pacearchaeota archaeon]|nr:HIT domain-containing protein [Candidatus Pacearchaeota archaeon]